MQYSGYLNPYVDEIISLHKQGLSPIKIGRQLYDRGVRSPWDTSSSPIPVDSLSAMVRHVLKRAGLVNPKVEHALNRALMKRKKTDIRLDELELSARLRNALQNEGCGTLEDAARRTEGELLRIPNFGRVSLNELANILKQYGFHFGWEGPPPKTTVKQDIKELAKIVTEMREDTRRLRQEISESHHAVSRAAETLGNIANAMGNKAQELGNAVNVTHNLVQGYKNLQLQALERLHDIKHEIIVDKRSGVTAQIHELRIILDGLKRAVQTMAGNIYVLNSLYMKGSGNEHAPAPETLNGREDNVSD